MAVIGLLQKGAKGVGSLGYQIAGFAAFGVVQGQVEQKYTEKTDKKVDPTLSSFLGGAIPAALWTAGSAVSRIRSAVLWGGASVLLDKLISSADEAAKVDDVDYGLMPNTAKAVLAQQRFETIMASAKAQREEARRLAERPAVQKVSDMRNRNDELLNRSAGVRANALADSFENPRDGMTVEEKNAARSAWLQRNKARKSITSEAQSLAKRARANAFAKRAKIESLKSEISGMSAKQLRAQQNRAQKKAAASMGRDRGGSRDGYKRKAMWTDKNGKVYRRRITLPSQKV